MTKDADDVPVEEVEVTDDPENRNCKSDNPVENNELDISFCINVFTSRSLVMTSDGNVT